MGSVGSDVAWSGISRDEWARALEAAGSPTESDDQAVTVREFMAMFGLRRSAAEARLQTLVEAGLAVRTRKRSHGTDGRLLFRAAWRLKAAQNAIPASARKTTRR